MGGVNPFTEKPKVVMPTQPFEVTFIPEQEGGKRGTPIVFKVNPGQFPYGHTGLDGSILDIAEGAGLELDHACGGVCACATCHVIVEAGLDSCSEATEDELDMVDTAPGSTIESRLSCQCVPNGRKSLTVIIPGWNKNYVKEGH
jgi:ferredoxin, 2Fe-2S